MPSPFPGMDLHIESPDWFPDLHGSLIVFMKEALQRSLRQLGRGLARVATLARDDSSHFVLVSI